MDKGFFLQLTSNLYKLTLFFPKKEPLRLKIRELGLDALEDFIKFKKTNPFPKFIPEILSDIEVLDGFFEIAKNQNWVSEAEILKLKQEYSMVGEELEKILFESDRERKEKENKPKAEGMRIPTSSRQQKILDIIKQGEKIQVKDLKTIFPETSKRTLRRDFEKLVKQGLIERIGENQDTFYRIKP